MKGGIGYVDFFFYTQESGTLVLSLDALFGLPRKNAAGISHRDSLHGNLIFGDQKAVDEHVSSYEMPRQNVPKVAFVT